MCHCASASLLLVGLVQQTLFMQRYIAGVMKWMCQEFLCLLEQIVARWWNGYYVLKQAIKHLIDTDRNRSISLDPTWQVPVHFCETRREVS